MDNLTEEQKDYIKSWNNGNFVKILNEISIMDLKIISPHIRLDVSYTCYIHNFQAYFKVFNNIKNKEQLKILISIDSKGIFDISTNNNKILLDAILKKDKELIKLIINHRNFTYPPIIDRYSYTDYRWYESSPMFYLVKNKNFEDYLDIIKFVYFSMNEKHKSKLLGDLFTALNINNKNMYILKCINYILSI